MEPSHPAGQSLGFALSEDVRRIFRGVDDHVVASILALKPTVAQLEEAATRMAGGGDIFADMRPEKGVVEAIIDLIEAEEDDPAGR